MGNRLAEAAMKYAAMSRYSAHDVSDEKRDESGKWTAGGLSQSKKAEVKKLPKADREWLREISDKADVDLPSEAQRAVSLFVGHDPKARDDDDEGGSFGLMIHRRMEDAFSEHPSEEGRKIREQLESAMKPVREELRNKYGDTVTLHRAQGEVGDDAEKRNVLSWTFNPEVADYFAGVEKANPPTNDQIRDAMKELQSKGEVKFRGYIFRRDPSNGEIDKWEAASSKNDESHISYIGDTIGEFASHLRRTQEWHRQKERDNSKKRQSIITAEVPIDDIVWLTDRANQVEAIVNNRTGKHKYSRTEGSLADRIKSAAEQTHRKPSESQVKAGNYPKGKFYWNGLEISIETPKGAKRHGHSIAMPHHYGFFRRTLGADGDQLDVFVGPHPESQLVFVVDQTKQSGRWDEHKILIGFRSESEAKAAYLASYPSGWKCGPITAMTVGQFLNWVRSGNPKKPIAQQVSKYEREGEMTRYQQAAMLYGKDAEFDYKPSAKRLWGDICNEAHKETGIVFDHENDEAVGSRDIKVGDNKFRVELRSAGGDWQSPTYYFRVQVMNGMIDGRSQRTKPYFVVIPGHENGNGNLIAKEDRNGKQSGWVPDETIQRKSEDRRDESKCWEFIKKTLEKMSKAPLRYAKSAASYSADSEIVDFQRRYGATEQPRDESGKWTSESGRKHADHLKKTWEAIKPSHDEYDLPATEKHHSEVSKASDSFPAKQKHAAARHLKHVGTLIQAMRLHANHHANPLGTEAMRQGLERKIESLHGIADASHDHLLHSLDSTMHGGVRWERDPATGKYSRLELAAMKYAASFSEEKHPRDESGKWTKGEHVLNAMSHVETQADKGALVSPHAVRQHLGWNKPEFDAAVKQLAAEGKISGHAHDFPSSLSAEEREKMVNVDGRHWVGIAKRPQTKSETPKKQKALTPDPQRAAEATAHDVHLPKTKKQLNIDTASEALSQMGYSLGEPRLDFKTKQMVYPLTMPDGKKSNASLDEIQTLVYRGHKDFKEESEGLVKKTGGSGSKENPPLFDDKSAEKHILNAIKRVNPEVENGDIALSKHVIEHLKKLGIDREQASRVLLDLMRQRKVILSRTSAGQVKAEGDMSPAHPLSKPEHELFREKNEHYDPKRTLGDYRAAFPYNYYNTVALWKHGDTKYARAAARYAAEHWITLENGTHVQVDGDGNITGGPEGLKSKGITNLSHFGKSESKSTTTVDKSESKSDSSPVASDVDAGAKFGGEDQKMETATRELPKLQGSEKQVKWAEEIRGKLLGAIPIGNALLARERAGIRDVLEKGCCELTKASSLISASQNGSLDAHVVAAGMGLGWYPGSWDSEERSQNEYVKSLMGQVSIVHGRGQQVDRNSVIDAGVDAGYSIEQIDEDLKALHLTDNETDENRETGRRFAEWRMSGDDRGPFMG